MQLTNTVETNLRITEYEYSSHCALISLIIHNNDPIQHLHSPMTSPKQPSVPLAQLCGRFQSSRVTLRCVAVNVNSPRERYALHHYIKSSKIIIL